MENISVRMTGCIMDTFEIMPARIKIVAILRNAILSGEFAAGSELSLTGIAGRLGVSRTPVREAFQTLEAEGLIALRMNKGAIVKPVNKEFITDHFRIRMVLEGEAVFRAITRGMDPDPLIRLHEAAEGGDSSMTTGAYEEYNQQFHSRIWDAAGGRKLAGILQSLWNGPSYGRVTDDSRHRALSIEEHGQIVLAVSAGDAEAGRQVMQRHIERSMENILKSVSPGE